MLALFAAPFISAYPGHDASTLSVNTTGEAKVELKGIPTIQAGWLAGMPMDSCSEACDAASLECHEEEVAKHDDDVKTLKEFNKLLSKLNLPECSENWDSEKYGQNLNVPNFATSKYTTPEQNSAVYCALSSSTKEAFSCSAKPFQQMSGGKPVGGEPQRLCYCSKARGIHYGDDVALINMYGKKKNKETYLDTFGVHEGGGYGVYAYPEHDRGNHGTSTWQILKADNLNAAGPVQYGDMIALKNKYTVKDTYLDTWGWIEKHSGYTHGGLGVSTHETHDRGGHDTSTWQITWTTQGGEKTGTVQYSDIIALENQYLVKAGGKGYWLDVWGGAHNNEGYGVMAHPKYNRGNYHSADWEIVAA